MTRNQLFELLGTTPTNPRWSWCALSPIQRRAVFTLWEDQIIDGRNRLSWDDYDVKTNHGANDQKRVLEKVIEENIPAYGIICVASDLTATPRRIGTVKAEFLIRLKIEQVGRMIYGVHIAAVPIEEIAATAKTERSRDLNALVDLPDPPVGSATLDRALMSRTVVIRDRAVRKYVLKMANGCCEFCKKEGFRMADGGFYLEAHHVIALSEEGRDQIDNVIALCPDHHRQAHFGADAQELELEFISKIQCRTWQRNAAR